ncbi:MAG: hypothetical protein Q4E17_03645 [Synergistes sp.]|nr:hypothetical protein [Synergistes sp.]
MIIASIIVILLLLLLIAGVYAFCAYVMYRVGDKFRIGSLRDYMIPIYNIVLLCDCAKITRLTAAGIIIPASAASLISLCCGDGVGSNIGIISLVCWVYLWGSIAEKLGKNFWLWGLASVLFGGIPVLFMAFDESMPKYE